MSDSTSTIGIIRRKINKGKIRLHLEKKYGITAIKNPNETCIFYTFEDGDRLVSLYVKIYARKKSYETYLDLAYSKNSVEIMKYIVSLYGGKMKDKQYCEDSTKYYKVEKI